MPSVVISVEGVSVVFPRKAESLLALQDITLEIPSGSLTTIVGPSGCGKSTLLKVVAGLVLPTQGRVSVDPARRAGGISYVPQAASLLPWRTARQNAAIGLELKKGQSLSNDDMEFVTSLFAEWKLDGFEDNYPDQLSGGMAQRVALIRSLASRPEILLCDEPFSAIDFVTRLRLTTEFKSRCRIDSITTILVTHNIEEAIFLGDQVVVMSGRPGRIVSIHKPSFSVGGHNAVACRASPEFGPLFERIWKDLEDHESI